MLYFSPYHFEVGSFVISRHRSSTVAVVISLAFCSALRAETRTWTDSTGKYKIEAEFVEITEGQVRLQRPDGKTVTLPLVKLSKDDQAHLRELVKGRRGGGADPNNPFEAGLERGEQGIGGYRVGDRVEIRDRGKWQPGSVVGFNDEREHILVKLDSTGKTAEAWAGENWIRVLPDGGPGGGKGTAAAGNIEVTLADMSSVHRVVALGAAGGAFKPDPATAEAAAARPRPVGLARRPGFFAETTSVSFASPAAMKAAVAMVGGPEMGDTTSLIEVCDLKTGRVTSAIPGPRDVQLVTVSPSGNRLATVAEVETFTHGPVQVWDVDGKTLKHVKSWQATNDEHNRKIEWMAWVDDQRLLTLDANALTLWEADYARAAYQISGQRMAPPSFSPGGKQIAIASQKNVDIHDASTGELAARISLEDSGWNRQAAISPSGKLVAVTGAAEVVVYNIASGEAMSRAYASTGAFSKGLAWLNESQVLVSGADVVDLPSQMAVWTYNHQAKHMAPGVGGRVWYMFDDHQSEQRVLLPFQLPHAAVKPVKDGELVLKPGDEVALELQIDDGALQSEAEQKLKKDLEDAGFKASPSAAAKLAARSGPGENHEMKYQEWGINRETHTINVTKREYELSLVVDGEAVWSRKQVQDAPHMLHLQKDESVNQAVDRVMKPNAGMFGVGLPSRVLPAAAGKARVSALSINGLQ